MYTLSRRFASDSLNTCDSIDIMLRAMQEMSAKVFIRKFFKQFLGLKSSSVRAAMASAILHAANVRYWPILLKTSDGNIL
jgi:hypothetical protein